MKIALVLKKLKSYRIFLILLSCNLLWMLYDFSFGMNSLKLAGSNMLEMLAVVPPIFILLGLLDVWIERETMMKLMGEGSGIMGVFLSFLMGAAAAGPLYAAFPVAGMLLKKSVKLSNVLIFIGSWSAVKIPMLLFEASSLGTKFTLIRLFFNLIAIGLMAFILERTLSPEDTEKIYTKAQQAD